MSESTTALSPVALLEALLFVAQGPVKEEDLLASAGLSAEEGEAAVQQLEVRLQTGGLRLQRLGRRVQLVTAPAAAPAIERFLDLNVELRLSQAALETLAIIAYGQPITRPQIEAIRGVGSDSVIRTLLSAGLIEDVGRANSVGRPILYSTTFEFLQQFGLESGADLPALEPPAALDDDPPVLPQATALEQA